MILLNVKGLSITVRENKKEKLLVNDVSFTLRMGQCIGILGESGSGKSITCKGIMKLLGENFNITGNIMYKDRDILEEKEENMRLIRGKEITMVMQNPMTSFDPLYTVGYQIKETLKEHTNLNDKEMKDKSIKILESVQLKEPEDILKKYPHQLSGGMLQRIMIGLAIAMKTNILIADEPTTAIDSITQYEIMKEFKKIKDKKIVGMIFISHDLGVISQIADYIIVMSNGEIMTQGEKSLVLKNPEDIHTKLLIEKKMKVLKKYQEIVKNRNGGIKNATRS